MKQPNLDDPDLKLDKLMSIWPGTITVFIRHKMLCVGCMVGSFHTVVDACAVYGLDEVAVRAELHAAADEYLKHHPEQQDGADRKQ